MSRFREKGTPRIVRIVVTGGPCAGKTSALVEIGRYFADAGWRVLTVAETATAATESIQRQNGDEGFSLEDVLADPEAEERMLEHIDLTQAIGKLGEREAMVIKLRYFHALTQQRVSVVLGVSQVQVSRIEKKALARLRELLS